MLAIGKDPPFHFSSDRCIKSDEMDAMPADLTIASYAQAGPVGDRNRVS